jgi:methyl-accepting chemotaxis protein
MGRGDPQNGMAVDADRQKDFPALPSYASYELGSLAQAFEVARTADDVADASQKLNSTIQQITVNSEETSAQANVASNAAQPVEEQNTTTNGMSRNVSDAARRSAVAARSPVTLRRSGSDRKHITGRRGTRKRQHRSWSQMSVQLDSWVERFKIDANEDRGGNNTAPMSWQAMSVGAGS